MVPTDPIGILLGLVFMSAADEKKDKMPWRHHDADAESKPAGSSREDGEVGEPIIGLKVFVVINFGRCMEANIREDEREE